MFINLEMFERDTLYGEKNAKEINLLRTKLSMRDWFGCGEPFLDLLLSSFSYCRLLLLALQLFYVVHLLCSLTLHTGSGAPVLVNVIRTLCTYIDLDRFLK